MPLAELQIVRLDLECPSSALSPSTESFAMYGIRTEVKVGSAYELPVLVFLYLIGERFLSCWIRLSFQRRIQIFRRIFSR